MRRGQFLRPLAPIVAALALTVGSAPIPLAEAEPREGKGRADKPARESDGAGQPPAEVAREATVEHQDEPAIVFGSAATGIPTGPAGRIETIEPVIGEPTQEQIDAVDAAPSGDQTDDQAEAEREARPDVDTDGDGVPDHSDNCWQLANPGQQDGDGDGLGNGCDEGSAPFLTPEEDEVVRAQRYIQDPSLVTGQPVEPAAAPQAPAAVPGEPVQIATGGTVAAPDESGRERESEPAAVAPEPAAESSGSNEPSGQAEQDGERDRGDRRERTRDGGEDDASASASEPPLTRVQRGERPRRNPALTEESGPVLPPPRSAKRYPLEPGFETIVRIDAGALGNGDAGGGRRRNERDEGDARRDSDGDGSRGNATEEQSARSSERGGGRSRGETGDSNKPSAAADRADTPGPVPIEDGVVLPATDAVAEDPEPDDAEIGRETGTALTNVVGWQATDDDAERGDGDATVATEDADEEGGRDRSKRDRGEKRSKRDRAEWDSDEFYQGGEATKRGEADSIAGTGEDDLFLTQRSGKGDEPGRFVYAIPVGEDGVYRVRLFFAETQYGVDGDGRGGTGERVFDVDAEGEPALRDFDIYDEVGAMTALVKMFDIEVDDGTLELEFEGRTGQPVVSAIEVLRQVGDLDVAASGRSSWSSVGLWRFTS